jgi:hypothetical protein
MRVEPNASELDRARRLHSALDHLSWNMRLTLFVASIIENNPGATAAVAALISSATSMAALLNDEQRNDIAEHMRLETQWLEARSKALN